MAVEDRVEPTQDVVDLLLGQHMQIRDLFTAVQANTGPARRDAYGQLVRLLAVHETAEEEVVHPLARRAIAGGDGVVEDRLTEEREAKEVLSRLESMDPDSEEFESLLETLRMSVLEHAHHEEHYEFRYLRQHYPAERLRTLAGVVWAAEKTAPTRPHPGLETAAANLAAGPVLALFDRARDTIRKATSTES